jgi:hypothetical protein
MIHLYIEGVMLFFLAEGFSKELSKPFHKLAASSTDWLHVCFGVWPD